MNEKKTIRDIAKTTALAILFGGVSLIASDKLIADPLNNVRRDGEIFYALTEKVRSDYGQQAKPTKPNRVDFIKKTHRLEDVLSEEGGIDLKKHFRKQGKLYLENKSSVGNGSSYYLGDIEGGKPKNFNGTKVYLTNSTKGIRKSEFYIADNPMDIITFKDLDDKLAILVGVDNLDRDGKEIQENWHLYEANHKLLDTDNPDWDSGMEYIYHTLKDVLRVDIPNEYKEAYIRNAVIHENTHVEDAKKLLSRGIKLRDIYNNPKMRRIAELRAYSNQFADSLLSFTGVECKIGSESVSGQGEMYQSLMKVLITDLMQGKSKREFIKSYDNVGKIRAKKLSSKYQYELD